MRQSSRKEDRERRGSFTSQPLLCSLLSPALLMSAIDGYAAICHLSCRDSCQIPSEVKNEIYWPLIVGATDEMAWKCTQVPPETNQKLLCSSKCNADYKDDLARDTPGALQPLNYSLPLQEKAGFPVLHLSWLSYSWMALGTGLEELVLTLFSRKFLSGSQQEIHRFHDNQWKSKWPCIKVKRIHFRMWIELQITKHKHKPKKLAVCKLIGFSIHRQKKKKRSEERRSPDTLLLVYTNR